MSNSSDQLNHGIQIKGELGANFNPGIGYFIVPPIIIVVGTVTSVLSIIVLTRKRMRKTPTMFYFTILSVADIQTLNGGFLRLWIKYTFKLDGQVYEGFGCKILVFLIYFIQHFAAWVLVVATVDRCVSVCLPFRGKRISTLRNAHIAVLAVFITFLTINLPLLWEVVTVTTAGDRRICAVTSSFNWYAWSWIDMTLFCILPFIIMITCNILISRQMWNSKRNLVKFDSASNTSTASQIRNGREETSSVGTKNVHTDSRHNSRQRRRELSFMTPMLLTTSWAYLLLTTPIGILLITRDLYRNEFEDKKWAVANVLQYTNNAIHFFLYLLTGSRFRSELKSLFCARCKQR